MAIFALDQLDVGQQGRVVNVSADPEVRHRLMEMGILRGSEIRVIRFAPMGDPIDVEVRGYHLSLRKSEARFVQVDLSGEGIPESEPKETPGSGSASRS